MWSLVSLADRTLSSVPGARTKCAPPQCSGQGGRGRVVWLQLARANAGPILVSHPSGRTNTKCAVSYSTLLYDSPANPTSLHQPSLLLYSPVEYMSLCPRVGRSVINSTAQVGRLARRCCCGGARLDWCLRPQAV